MNLLVAVLNAFNSCVGTGLCHIITGTKTGAKALGYQSKQSAVTFCRVAASLFVLPRKKSNIESGGKENFCRHTMLCDKFVL